MCASLIFRKRARKSARANFIDREPGIKESRIVAVRGRSSKDSSRSPGKHRCWPGAGGAEWGSRRVRWAKLVDRLSFLCPEFLSVSTGRRFRKGLSEKKTSEVLTVKKRSSVEMQENGG